MITITYLDHDGSEQEHRFWYEVDAINFEEGLTAEGLTGIRSETHYQRVANLDLGVMVVDSTKSGGSCFASGQRPTEHKGKLNTNTARSTAVGEIPLGSWEMIFHQSP
jgi:hypothetical protein